VRTYIHACVIAYCASHIAHYVFAGLQSPEVVMRDIDFSKYYPAARC